MARIIDVHSHFTLPRYYEALEKHGVLMNDGFPIPHWKAEDTLELMDKTGIEWSLLTISSPHLHFGDDGESIELCRYVNETIAQEKKKYPDKFGFGAHLPLPNVDAAVKEAVYALDTLNADCIKVVSSTSDGQYLGNKALEPLWAELNKRNAVVVVHPHRPPVLTEGVFTSGPISLFEFLCDTTRSVMDMIASGVFERYPNIKLIVPHCGSFLPNIYNRFKLVGLVLVPMGLMPDIDVAKSFESIYFDVAGNPVPNLLEFLLTVTTPDHIMYGGDFPFTRIDTVQNHVNGLIKMMDEKPNLTPYKDMILYENAAKMFGRPL